ncbi:hypothetical protein Tco_0788113 [Tanacetum coccineum]
MEGMEDKLKSIRDKVDQFEMKDIFNKDDIDEEDDESSTMEPPSRNEAIKAAITLNNFLLSYEKTTPEVLTMLRKIRDEIQGEIDFNKKQKTIEYLVIWFLLYLQPCRSAVFAALQVCSIVNDSLGVTRMLIVIVQSDNYTPFRYRS